MPLPLVRILDEERLVARLVVEQLIHDLTHEQSNSGARASRPLRSELPLWAERRGRPVRFGRNQPPYLALFSAVAVSLRFAQTQASPPPCRGRRKLALFFGHFWIKWLILNHLVALFPLEIALFYTFLGSAVGDWLVY